MTPQTLQAPLHNPLAAALWMSGSIASFTAMAIAARQINGAHDTFEIMTFRSAVGFLIVLAFASYTRSFRDISAARLGGHLFRNIVHFSGQNLWFLALTMIPLAQVFALEFTSPLWVILLSPLFLGEALTKKRILAASLGFLGILVVARPDFETVDLGVLAAAGSAICFAITGIATKRLTRNETIISILFWLTLMQFVFGAVTAGWDGQVSLPTWSTAPWLFLIGCAGILAHLCLTSALRLAPASFVMPIDFIRLPLIAGIGMVFYAEPVDLGVFAGAALIISGNLINLRSQTQEKRA